MENVDLTAEEIEDRAFVRALYRNRVHAAHILLNINPPTHGLETPPENRMAAIEDEWRRKDKRRANDED